MAALADRAETAEREAAQLREQLRELYKRATQQKYGFLYYRPRSNDLEHMFYANFTERLLVS